MDLAKLDCGDSWTIKTKLHLGKRRHPNEPNPNTVEALGYDCGRCGRFIPWEEKMLSPPCLRALHTREGRG